MIFPRQLVIGALIFSFSLVGASWLRASVVTTALAQSESSGQVNVTASVPSPVSASLSTVTVDLTSVPADGISIIIITARIVDSSGDPLPNRYVEVTSNRGEVDIIRCYDGSTLTDVNNAMTDSGGEVRCAITSEAPGDATISTTADTVVLNDKPTINFQPLPTISRLTLSVKLPAKILGKDRLIILEPPKPLKDHRDARTQSPRRLVNTDVDLELSFISLVLTIIFGLIFIGMLIAILLLLKKVRRAIQTEQKYIAQEKELLAKTFVLEERIARELNVPSINLADQTVANIDTTNANDENLAPPAPADADQPTDSKLPPLQ